MVDWLTIDEAVFYGLVWTVAFVVAIFRGLSGGAAQSIGVRVGSGGISGFLAFTVVSLWSSYDPSPIVSHWYYLGVASLIGLAGPYQEAIIKALIDKIGLSDDDSE